MNNRSLILAAGRGSRMGLETANKPKGLTMLLGKPLLNWQMETLKNPKIDTKVVVTGYRSDMIIGDFVKYENKRWSETNMVTSLFCAPAFIGNTIVSYSDIVYHPDHISKLMESPYDITITADKKWESLWRLRFEDPLDDAETFIHENDRLIEIGKKTDDVSNIQAQYMGLIKLSEKGWSIMSQLYNSFSPEKQDKMDMTAILNECLDHDIKVNIVFVEGKWCEVDSHEDALLYEKELSQNENWSHDWR